MPSFALSAIGKDRPGIVAAIARVLYEQGCNIEDASMTMLRGNFAVMLVLAAPDGTTPARLEDALGPACDALGLLCSVREVDDESVHPHPTHTLTVYGADRPGIVYRVAQELAVRGVNITNLTSRVVSEDTSPVYVMMLELAAPYAAGLEDALAAIAVELGVDVSLRPAEDDVL